MTLKTMVQEKMMMDSKMRKVSRSRWLKPRNRRR